MPKFSVVIPLYNKENYIKKTIESVINQSFADFEILIINDCSTDGSLEIAKGIPDDRIKVIEHSENKGLSASRNTGIKNATANYIAFLDADDLWKPTFLQKINFLITQYPTASLFATKYEVFIKGSRTLIPSFHIDNFSEHGIIPNFFECSLNQSIYYPSCLCVSKNVFEEVGLYDERINYSEDVDFNIRAHAKFKLAYWEEALVTYLLVSENQITRGSLSGKTIPDYDYYETKYKDRKDIKKYLDFQRYIKAKQFKLANEKDKYQELVSAIDFNTLNYKQKFLLSLPKSMLQGIGKLKQFLSRAGFEVSSYSK